jgi:hypothetical protein
LKLITSSRDVINAVILYLTSSDSDDLDDLRVRAPFYAWLWDLWRFGSWCRETERVSVEERELV